MSGFEGRPARSGCAIIATAVLLAASPAAPAGAQEAAQQPAPAEQSPPSTQAPAQPPAQPPAAQSNPFTFDSNAAMLTFFIKPDKAADFEKVMAKLHEALAKSERPERRQQALGWKLYKVSEPGPNGTVLYINLLSPVLKGADYTISRILAESYPQEVQQLFPLYRDAMAGLSRAELTLVDDFSTPPKPPPPPASTPPAQ